MIKTFNGDVFADDRGLLRFVKDFDFSKILRFYQVENYNTQIIRAFHGHMKEEKFVYVASGSILLCVAPLSNPENPAKDVTIERIVISAHSPKIIHIPAGNANGFRALEVPTVVQFFSTFSTEDSKNDDYRFPANYWGESIWLTENR